MGLKCSFMDNETYGAQDVNYALSRLTTQGVSMFMYQDGDNPLISLNDAVSSFAEAGVERYNVDACRVIKTNDDRFMVKIGTAFMYDGSFISVEDEDYDITDEIANVRNGEEADVYVYFYRDISYNAIYLRVRSTDDEINDEKAVALAKITASDEILDLRYFSECKICPVTSNIVFKYDCPSISVNQNQTGQKRLRLTLDGVFSGVKYCFYGGYMLPVQRVNTTTGEELDYECNHYTNIDIGCFGAVNYQNDKLELWLYSTNGNWLCHQCELYAF